jgi:hypothetical protein
MAHALSLLSRLTTAGAKIESDKDSGLDVLHVDNSHALIQAAGYLKYTLAKESKKGVFFRGQTKLYNGLAPALLRGVKDGPPNVKRRARIAEFLALRAVNPNCREALLQHYGIRTTWLDVVDNVWVALWFACHQALIKGWPEEYLHFEKRTPGTRSQYAYLLLLESAFFEPVDGQPGLYRDERSETIDLRVAVPSHFLRPHAQHGLLVRRLSKAGLPVSDYSPLIAGTIRVDLANAIDWMGNGSTLVVHSIFPPAYYDSGYLELLKGVVPEHRDLGSIHRIQP